MTATATSWGHTGPPMSQAKPEVDGRRLRRLHGRQATIDALLDLVLEGSTVSTASVCDRAGISEATLFRYFESLGEMRQAAIGRYFERFDDLLTIADCGEGSPADRLRSFVAARDGFYTATAPITRFSRSQALRVGQLAQTIDRVRLTFATQIAQHFAPELDGLDRATRLQRVAVVAVLTSFESWDQLEHLGDDCRRAALAAAVGDILRIDA